MGNLQKFDKLHHAAILIVDITKEFLVSDGVKVVAESEAIVKPNQDLIAAGRAAGVPILYCNDTHRPGKPDAEFELCSDHCFAGTPGAEVIDQLAPQPQDYQIPKRRYSAFFQTDLDITLRELGVKNVIVTGVLTNICVRSTVHDAFFLGYRVFVPADCCQGSSKAIHDAALWDIDHYYGYVTDSATAIRLLSR